MSRPALDYRSLIVTVVLAGIVLCYVTFIFLPGQKSIAEARESLSQQRQFVMNAELLRPMLEQTRQQLQESRQFRRDWQEQTVDSSRQAELLGDVSECFRNANVDLLRLAPEPPFAGATLSEFAFRIECTGNYQQIHQLLYQLESLPSAPRLEFLLLRASPTQPGQLRCEMNVVVFADNSDKSD